MRKIAEFSNGSVSSQKTVKVYRDSENQEYIARMFYSGVEYRPACYFSDDKDDVMNTARCMLEEKE